MSTLTRFLEWGPVKGFQPSPSATQSDTDILNRLAILVGCVALGLPTVLALGGTFTDSCFRDSISHFYFAQFWGSVFVGLLYFIGGFLIAYRGATALENGGSNLAGVGAMMVASFPTALSGCERATAYESRVFADVQNVGTPDAPLYKILGEPSVSYFELFGDASNWHLFGAAVVFGYLGLFCLIVLKRVVRDRHIVNGALIASKRKRNRYYSYCGLTILACVGVLGLKGAAIKGDALIWWNSYNLTFWVEAVALWAFGLAWFAKGRLFDRFNDG